MTHVSSAFGQTGVGLSRGRAEFTGLFDFCTERIQEAALVGLEVHLEWLVPLVPCPERSLVWRRVPLRDPPILAYRAHSP